MQAFLNFSFNKHWFEPLSQLSEQLELGNQTEVFTAYRSLFRGLAEHGFESLAHAFADGLLFEDSSLSLATLKKDIPEGLKSAALFDLDNVLQLLKRDFSAETSDLIGKTVPNLSQLAPSPLEPVVSELSQALGALTVESVWAFLLDSYEKSGTGVLARHKAFSYSNGSFSGIESPVELSLDQLFDLDKQLSSLRDNTEALLKGFKAQHCLLYGPRGSGKSTAVRALLNRFESQGLRLVELAADDLAVLHDLVDALRDRPHYYVVFVDDLSFEAGDTSYQPLKTILEGSLKSQASNVLIYATSNRRHLVKEQFSDRPDPLNDDVHGWDTHHERLALSDRFGLTITFPGPSQKRYVTIVESLAAREGLSIDNLKPRAVRYADWGNGYSGRTAQQFIDSFKAGLA